MDVDGSVEAALVIHPERVTSMHLRDADPEGLKMKVESRSVVIIRKKSSQSEP